MNLLALLAAANASSGAEEAEEIIRSTGDRVESGFWTTINEVLLRIPALLAFVVALVGAWLLGRVCSRLVCRRFARRNKEDLGRLLGTAAQGLVLFVCGLFALTLLFPSVKPTNVLSALGVGSIAIGFAFKDILQNLISGVILLLREPYRRGDEIVVGDGEYQGRVEEVEARATHIRTIDRGMVVIPNVKLFSDAITVNTDSPVRMIRSRLSIAYGADPRQAMEIVLQALRSAEGVQQEPAPWVTIDALNEYSIDLVFAFAAAAGEVEQIKTKGSALLAVYDACLAHGIELPFPTQVTLLRPYEDASGGSDKLHA